MAIANKIKSVSASGADCDGALRLLSWTELVFNSRQSEHILVYDALLE